MVIVIFLSLNLRRETRIINKTSEDLAELGLSLLNLHGVSSPKTITAWWLSDGSQVAVAEG